MKTNYRHSDSNRRMHRRDFTTTALAGAAGALAAPALLRGQNPSDKLNIAIIGSGGRGGSNLRNVASENIVALCDVNERNLKAASEKYPQARTFADFRMLYDYADEFDAVVVST